MIGKAATENPQTIVIVKANNLVRMGPVSELPIFISTEVWPPISGIPTPLVAHQTRKQRLELQTSDEGTPRTCCRAFYHCDHGSILFVAGTAAGTPFVGVGGAMDSALECGLDRGTEVVILTLLHTALFVETDSLLCLPSRFPLP